MSTNHEVVRERLEKLAVKVQELQSDNNRKRSDDIDDLVVAFIEDAEASVRAASEWL